MDSGLRVLVGPDLQNEAGSGWLRWVFQLQQLEVLTLEELPHMVLRASMDRVLDPLLAKCLNHNQSRTKFTSFSGFSQDGISRQKLMLKVEKGHSRKQTRLSGWLS